MPAQPMAEEIAQRLQEDIASGRLAPGAPIRQEAVAAERGVSRLPVREALRRLESQGLVVLRPHAGARVAVLDFGECLEIYKIRERLEPLAFSESARRITEEQVEEVQRVLARLQEIRDPAAWIEADRAFHLSLYAGLQTQRMLSTIVGFWNTTQRYRRILLTTFDDRDFRLADDEHRLMVDALLSGEIRRGEDIVRTAMERSRLRLARHRELFDR